jgi:hypothetical protein
MSCFADHRRKFFLVSLVVIGVFTHVPRVFGEQETNGNHVGACDVGIWYCTYFGADWTSVVGYANAKNFLPLCSPKPGDYRHYASDDAEVIDFHLQQIAEAKIDFLLLELTPGGLDGYRNSGWKEDVCMVDCARKVCQRIKAWNDAHDWKIKYALAVCTQIKGDDSWGLAIEKITKDVYTTFYNNQDYGGPYNYYQLNGKPLMVNYGLRLSQLKSEWDAYAGDKTYGNHFTLRTCTGYAEAGEYGWPLPLHKGTLLDAEVELVEPGFNVHRSDEVELRNNGEFYRQCWQRVLDNPKPRIVMIQAFNDYLEESAVWITDTSNLDDTQEKWTTSDGKPSPSMYWDMTKEYIAKLRNQPVTN